MTHTAKHTPGPLKAVQIIIENSPCTWAVQRKSIREQWGKPSIATYIDNEADARLFAAAPAMYEAIRKVIEHRAKEYLDNTVEPYCSLVAALAQAEARS
jgi:spore coat polysaccharide biosynthesis protein SpsF (cytidylyltransferase family)